MKTYKNLFEKIIDVNNFYKSLQLTSKGKRHRFECLLFHENMYANMKTLRESVESGTFRKSPSTTFAVFDPKPRTITALHFRDRIVQHAIYAVIYPIFDKTFLPNSYACRRCKGTHKVSKDLQSTLRKGRYSWYLKTDYSKFFHSICRKTLWKCIERKIGCRKTLNLIEQFIPRDGHGLNIGELLSQLFANVMGNIVDYYIKHELKSRHFYRYMDDIVILGESRNELIEVKDKLESFSNGINLKFSKWFIKPTSSNINFVGYRIWGTHKLIRKDSIARAKRKINNLTGVKRCQFLASWKGHLQHANTFNLIKKMGIERELAQYD